MSGPKYCKKYSSFLCPDQASGQCDQCPKRIECAHGQLARQCNICELEQDLSRERNTREVLVSENDRLRKQLGESDSREKYLIAVIEKMDQESDEEAASDETGASEEPKTSELSEADEDDMSIYGSEDFE